MSTWRDCPLQEKPRCCYEPLLLLLHRHCSDLLLANALLSAGHCTALICRWPLHCPLLPPCVTAHSLTLHPPTTYQGFKLKSFQRGPKPPITITKNDTDIFLKKHIQKSLQWEDLLKCSPKLLEKNGQTIFNIREGVKKQKTVFFRTLS